jgi:tRNA-specific 2-thiouridylase
MKKRIAVAMSGGTDSSFAAWLLVRRGFSVEGFTLKMLGPAEDAESERSCCSSGSLARAAEICRKLGIPHTVLSVTDLFHERVIADFLDRYAEGLTPNPCIRCNRDVKFGYLLDRVRALGFDFLATGHYARTGRTWTGRPCIRTGRDRSKDQAYFLAGLRPEQAERIMFPLGGWTKPEVERAAIRAGLFRAPLRESQDVCFLGASGSVREFLRRRLPESVISPGKFVDIRGKELGRHDGLAFYTVGQRRGLGVASTERFYVRKMDPSKHEIVLGKKSELQERSVFVNQVNFVSGRPEQGWMTVRIRHRARPRLCRLVLLEGGRGRADLVSGRIDIPAGQWAVFYRGNRLVGGGEIQRT